MSPETDKINEDAIKAYFGDNLKFARTRLGLSQAELAVKADTQRVVVGAVERGDHNATFKVIVRLCLAVGYHPADLFRADFLQVIPSTVTARHSEGTASAASKKLAR